MSQTFERKNFQDKISDESKLQGSKHSKGKIDFGFEDEGKGFENRIQPNLLQLLGQAKGRSSSIKSSEKFDQSQGGGMSQQQQQNLTTYIGQKRVSDFLPKQQNIQPQQQQQQHQQQQQGGSYFSICATAGREQQQLSNKIPLLSPATSAPKLVHNINNNNNGNEIFGQQLSGTLSQQHQQPPHNKQKQFLGTTNQAGKQFLSKPIQKQSLLNIEEPNQHMQTYSGNSSPPLLFSPSSSSSFQQMNQLRQHKPQRNDQFVNKIPSNNSTINGNTQDVTYNTSITSMKQTTNTNGIAVNKPIQGYQKQMTVGQQQSTSEKQSLNHQPPPLPPHSQQQQKQIQQLDDYHQQQLQQIIGTNNQSKFDQQQQWQASAQKKNKKVIQKMEGQQSGGNVPGSFQQLSAMLGSGIASPQFQSNGNFKLTDSCQQIIDTQSSRQSISNLHLTTNTYQNSNLNHSHQILNYTNNSSISQIVNQSLNFKNHNNNITAQSFLHNNNNISINNTHNKQQIFNPALQFITFQKNSLPLDVSAEMQQLAYPNNNKSNNQMQEQKNQIYQLQQYQKEQQNDQIIKSSSQVQEELIQKIHKQGNQFLTTSQIPLSQQEQHQFSNDHSVQPIPKQLKSSIKRTPSNSITQNPLLNSDFKPTTPNVPHHKPNMNSQEKTICFQEKQKNVQIIDKSKQAQQQLYPFQINLHKTKQQITPSNDSNQENQCLNQHLLSMNSAKLDSESSCNAKKQTNLSQASTFDPSQLIRPASALVSSKLKHQQIVSPSSALSRVLPVSGDSYKQQSMRSISQASQSPLVNLKSFLQDLKQFQDFRHSLNTYIDFIANIKHPFIFKEQHQQQNEQESVEQQLYKLAIISEDRSKLKQKKWQEELQQKLKNYNIPKDKGNIRR